MVTVKPWLFSSLISSALSTGIMLAIASSIPQASAISFATFLLSSVELWISWPITFHICNTCPNVILRLIRQNYHTDKSISFCDPNSVFVSCSVLLYWTLKVIGTAYFWSKRSFPAVMLGPRRSQHEPTNRMMFRESESNGWDYSWYYVHEGFCDFTLKNHHNKPRWLKATEGLFARI